MRTSSLLLALALAGGPLHADTVKLSDGSSLSGQVTELENGDLKVVTGAGEMTVPKAKVSTVVKDGSAAEGEHRNEYVEKVLERRRAYGNEDGIPRSVNLQSNQLMLTLGQLNYVGDAYSTLSSDLAGMSYGLAWAHSYTDFVALEAWGDYSFVSKDVSGVTVQLQRYNVGVGPKIQKAIQIGRVESGMVLLPNISLTAVYSAANASAPGSSSSSSSVGGAASAGLDFQFGGAIVGVKARYLLTTDVSNQNPSRSSNTSAFIPQVGVGFNF